MDATRANRRFPNVLALFAAFAGSALPLQFQFDGLKPSADVRFAMATPSSSFSAKVERTQYRGWNVYRLTNGLVTLYIAPEIGGRAIQLQLGDDEYFFVNEALAGKVLPESENNPQAGWANYGGDKVWPAPEGWSSDEEWPSVPYYILDGSKWDSEIVTNNAREVAVRVTSPKDPRSGVQFARTFHVYAGTTRIKVEQLMRNISRRRIRWGIWHLTQHDAADRNDPSKPNPELFMYVPLNPMSMHPGGYYRVFGDVKHPSYQLTEGGTMLRIQYLYRVGKIGADSDRGWFAVVNGQKNLGFIENFTFVARAEYPDNASVESWNNGAGTISRGPFDQHLPDDPKKTLYFFESEALSPYAALEPGEEYTQVISWAPTRIPNPVRDASGSGAVSEPLRATAAGGAISLTGVFGVFFAGTLEAVVYSPIGEELSREVLQAVDPREVVRIEKSIQAPENVFRVSVRVLDAEGENRGYLGNAILK